MASLSCISSSGPAFVVLSGASQGIGRAIAIEVSKHIPQNSVMVLVARNKAELEKTAGLCDGNGKKIICESKDLSKTSPKEMHDLIVKNMEGRSASDYATAIIFHNVGSLGNLAVDTARMENVPELRDYYDLNVFNVIVLNTEFMKVFASVEDRIVVVNITSLCAIKPMSGMAYYCSGKAAREMYFRVLAEEKKNTKVLNYSPGPVETAMIDHVLAEAVNENLRDVFTSFRQQKTLLTPKMTAAKCLSILLQGKFTSGEHVDYFDVE